jgi:aminomethyltransferase
MALRPLTKAALIAARERGPRKRLFGLRTEDARSVARQGYKVFRGEREIGTISSGTFAPSFNRPLAMAYIRADAVDGNWPRPGDALEVEVRNRKAAASVTPLPFYRAPRPQSA